MLNNYWINGSKQQSREVAREGIIIPYSHTVKFMFKEAELAKQNHIETM